MKNTPESLYSVASKLAIPLAAYFIGLFFLMNLVYEKSQYSLILFVLILMVPLLIYKYAKKYRDMFAGGVLSYMNAWRFCATLFIFASLLFSFFIYIYTTFLNTEYASWMMQTSIQYLEQIIKQAPKESEVAFAKEWLEKTKELSLPTPIEMAVQTFWMVLNGGFITALVVSFFVKKKPPFIGDQHNNDTITEE
ncbi:MAG: DUF4199 domain-containing protein [Bacteroidales bacterium]|nr:DUF4199 domain-containing protein [Bacteroidales bacterium]MDD4821024.1 DUF4199 domain-containing protein [Bacteroidales bacterium]